MAGVGADVDPREEVVGLEPVDPAADRQQRRHPGRAVDGVRFDVVRRRRKLNAPHGGRPVELDPPDCGAGAAHVLRGRDDDGLVTEPANHRGERMDAGGLEAVVVRDDDLHSPTVSTIVTRSASSTIASARPLPEP